MPCEGLRSTYASFMADVRIYIVNFCNTILNKFVCKCHVGISLKYIPNQIWRLLLLKYHAYERGGQKLGDQDFKFRVEVDFR